MIETLAGPVIETVLHLMPLYAPHGFGPLSRPVADETGVVSALQDFAVTIVLVWARPPAAFLSSYLRSSP